MATNEETPASLQEKLGQTQTVLYDLDQLYLEAFSAPVRLLHRLCLGLPTGLLPPALLWSLMVAGLAGLPGPQNPVLVQTYLLGLGTLLATGLALFCLRFLTDQWSTDDHILERIAQHPGLAYHPNAVLRRSVARRGAAQQGELREWFLAQHQILSARARDYSAWRDSLLREPQPLPSTALPKGARAFLKG